MSKRKMYNTTLDAVLIKKIRILAAQLDKRQNELLEEAIQELLTKYKNQDTQESPFAPASWILTRKKTIHIFNLYSPKLISSYSTFRKPYLFITI